MLVIETPKEGTTIMSVLKAISWVIAALFFVCYLYQFLYIPAALALKDQPHGDKKLHRFAVLICARNEQAVIADLLHSIRSQTYPQALLEVFVMADNCTDRTAEIARMCGATVYERENHELVGKGYALEALLEHIRADCPNGFDGYFVFDADNVLAPDYIEQMNATFSDGYRIVTSYRNSKNYGGNWISAGYALWFLRESQYLNRARMRLGTSCAVSGTGFLFSQSVLDETGGWRFHLLTEDIEFSVHHILRGETIGYCEAAELYDEQPTSFRQSWRQRMRWSKGYLQVFRARGKDLLRAVLDGDFAAFDMSMAIMPAFVLSVAGMLVELAMIVLGLAQGGGVMAALAALGRMFGSMYLTLFVLGAITTATEWRHIHTTTGKKIRYLLTFPLFLFTYLPVSVAALFSRVEWKPIAHSVPASALEREMRETRRIVPAEKRSA